MNPKLRCHDQGVTNSSKRTQARILKRKTRVFQIAHSLRLMMKGRIKQEMMRMCLKLCYILYQNGLKAFLNTTQPLFSHKIIILLSIEIL